MAVRFPSPPLEIAGHASLRSRWVFLAGSFFATLFVTYLSLMLVWLPAGSTYRRLLIGMGNTVFGHTGHSREVLFLEHTAGSKAGVSERVDVVVLVRDSQWFDDKAQKKWVLGKGIATFYQPYLATSFLVSLVLATPLPWRHRLKRGLVAFVTLHAYLIGAVGIDVEEVWLRLGGEAARSSRDFADTISLLHATITDWPAGVFLVPLLLWALAFGSLLLRVTTKNRVLLG